MGNIHPKVNHGNWANPQAMELISEGQVERLGWLKSLSHVHFHIKD